MITVDKTIAACNEARAALIAAYRAMPYPDYLRTDHWLAIRAAAIERSGGRCQMCGRQEKLHVHHNSYKNLGEERSEDLLVLCQDCHAKFHVKAVPAVSNMAEKTNGNHIQKVAAQAPSRARRAPGQAQPRRPSVPSEQRDAAPPAVASVEVRDDFVICVSFRDGSKRTIDFKPVLGLKELGGLEDEQLFKQASVDSHGNLTWPNQACLFQDILYDWGRYGKDLALRAQGDRLEAKMSRIKDSARRIRKAEIVGPFRLYIVLANGRDEIIDFNGWVKIEKLEALQDLNVFNQFFIDDSGRLRWPNQMYALVPFTRIRNLTWHNGDFSVGIHMEVIWMEPRP